MQEYQRRVNDVECLKELEIFHEQNLITRNLLKMLGSFWEEYYPDLETAVSLSSGLVTLQSDTYNQILDLCLSSNLFDIPPDNKLYQELFLFQEDKLEPNYDSNNELEYYSIKIDGFRDVKYIVSSIISPDVILERGKEFETIDDELRLYVDLFDDPNIFDFTYRAEATYTSHVILWGVNILLDTYHIWNRFGRFLYTDEPDTEEYRQLVLALLYFFTNTKSVNRLEAVMNIQFGAPFSQVEGEIVKEITPPVSAEELGIGLHNIAHYNIIKTTHNEYYSPHFYNILVEEGDVLSDYQLLARFHTVDDYISDPEWYKDTPFPVEIIDPKSVNAPDFGNEIDNIEVFKYNDIYNYDDEIPYDANHLSFQEWVAFYEKEDLRSFRISPDEEEGTWRKYFYELIDKVLKYNLFIIRTNITFDTYEYFDFVRGVLLKYIDEGIPVYLHSILDSALLIIEESILRAEDGDLNISFTSNLGKSDYLVSEDRNLNYDADRRYRGDRGYCYYNTYYNYHKNLLKQVKETEFPESIWFYNSFGWYNSDHKYGRYTKYIDSADFWNIYSFPEPLPVEDGDTNLNVNKSVYSDYGTLYNIFDNKIISELSSQIDGSRWLYNNLNRYTGEHDYHSYNQYVDSVVYDFINSFLEPLPVEDGNNNINLEQALGYSNYKENEDVYNDEIKAHILKEKTDRFISGSIDYGDFRNKYNHNHTYFVGGYNNYKGIFNDYSGYGLYGITVNHKEFSDLNIANSFNSSFGTTGDILQIEEYTDPNYNKLLRYEGIRDYL